MLALPIVPFANSTRADPAWIDLCRRNCHTWPWNFLRRGPERKDPIQATTQEGAIAIPPGGVESKAQPWPKGQLGASGKGLN